MQDPVASLREGRLVIDLHDHTPCYNDEQILHRRALPPEISTKVVEIATLTEYGLPRFLLTSSPKAHQIGITTSL